MTYSIDLRERAVWYVRAGGSQKDACALFKISSRTLYNWLRRTDLRPQDRKLRKRFHRKLDREALRAHVRANPDAYLRERAEHFGVHINAIWHALRQLGISKKNDTLSGKMPKKPGKLS